MQLHFRRLSADYYIADPAGGKTTRLGQEVYVLRAVPTNIPLEERTWFAAAPEGYIIVDRLTWRQAKLACERDAPLYLRGELPMG